MPNTYNSRKLRSREDVATRASLAELKEALTWRMVIAIGVAAAITSAIIKLL